MNFIPESADQILQRAVLHHQARRLEQAKELYSRIVQQNPEHAVALHLLGVLAAQEERYDLAVELIRRALAVQPHFPAALNHLGLVLQKLGKAEDSIAAYRRATVQQPNFPEAFYNLGNALAATGDTTSATNAYHQAIALQPNYPDAFYNLGNALYAERRFDEAINAYQQAITLKRSFPQAHCNLGNTLKNVGRLDEAIASYRQAIAIQPDLAQAYCNLGNLLIEMGHPDEAVRACGRAIALKPDYADAFDILGTALKRKGDLDGAIASHRHALQLEPNSAQAHCNLGIALTDSGMIDEAMRALRHALVLQPNVARFYSTFLYSIHLHLDFDPQAIAREHRVWNREHAEPLKEMIQPHLNNRDPDRKIRIGYVSPDFREHVVGQFLLPILSHHDKSRVEVHAYSQVTHPDEMSRKIRVQTDAWRSIVGLSDQQTAEFIRRDGIDILIDLAMHTANNRLLVFAQKPAPVQVTYLAYCSTTGLETIDYRLSDPYLDPDEGGDEALYSERTIRLPNTYWCYQPCIETPEISPLPASKNSFITFGCLNNFCKVNRSTLATWARILRMVPKSRLVLHAPAGSHRQIVQDIFEREGVESDRVRFVGLVPLKEYFPLYHGIDIALDTFPYCGGTTTCDALWMGTPVVTLRGKTAVGRGGVSILNNAGLPELIAGSPDDYVRVAVNLACDMSRLAKLRQTMRGRMLDSPLIDSLRFTRHLEAALQAMWHAWCASS